MRHLISPWSRFNRDLHELFSETFGAETFSQHSSRVGTTDRGYQVELDLPGIDPKVIQVTVEKDTLYVTGRRGEEEPFTYGFVVPEDTNLEGIRATSKNGVLLIEVPKIVPTKAAAKKIAIQVL